MTVRASIALAALMCTSACAPTFTKLPSGQGAPAADADAALDQALATCKGISSVTAEMAVAGRVGGRRLRARLAVGLSAPASVYLEAPAPFGSPLFVLAAIDDEATVWLPRDRRVLEHGRPAEVVEAIVGVPLGPADLRATLTGCAPRPAAGGARMLGDRWRIVPGAQELYLHRARTADAWRLVAVVHHQAGQTEWRAEYREFLGGVPRSVRLASVDPRRFSLDVDLTQVEINVPFAAEAFHVRIPPGASPMTLDELRDGGPLADRTSAPHE